MIFKKKLKKDAWREALKIFESSDMTVAEFCRQQGISVPTFYHRNRKLAHMEVSQPKTAFVKIKPIRTHEVVCKIRVGRMRLECVDWPPVAWLREVLSL